MSEQIPVLKDEEQELPIPSEWRAKLKDIADALKDRNFVLDGIVDVDQLDKKTAEGIAENIQSYGYALDTISDESWNTSIYLWMGDYWDVIVDLSTIEEGRSDLVLHVFVFEKPDGYRFKVHFVYVP